MWSIFLESIKNELLYQVLVDIVINVNVTENHIIETYNSKRGDWNHEAPYEEIKQEIENWLVYQNKDAAMKAWFKEQYKIANIKIIDHDYDNVIDMLNN